MFAIYKKELRNYFTTPLGYVFMAVFLAVSGFVFSVSTFRSQTSDMSGYCQLMIFGYIVIVPMLTMRSFAEERRTRTEQLLLTSPISITSMIFSKFFAAMTMFAGSVLISCLYYIPIFNYGEPNVGKAVGCLIAMLLIGCAFISVGIFVSTLTESAVTACVGTMGILVLFAGFSLFNGLIDSYVIRSILSWLSIYSRYSYFTYGIFDVSSAVYYLSISAIFLFLSVRMYERRRYA
ncbi:MAG: ABC transporter permease subunit [Clostridia bacterium]|nr:ABC transporter permease subunit [Clostridia bacterium]